MQRIWGEKEKGGCIAAGPQAHGAGLKIVFFFSFLLRFTVEKSYKEDSNGWMGMGVFLLFVLLT